MHFNFEISHSTLISAPDMSPQTTQADVCIIGSGAIGKTAALGFSQVGLRVALVGGFPPPVVTDNWDVRVFALNHTAHDLLAGLKVWGALNATRVAEVSGMQITDAADLAQASAEKSRRLDFDAYGARVNELAWIVEDGNLNQALDSALKFAQNLSLVNVKATSVEITDEAAVVDIENGSKISAPLLVGADGAHSWVRAQCEIAVDYRSYGQQGVVTNFACEKPHQGVAHQWFVGDQGIIALLPLPNQQVSLVWSAPNALAETLLKESASQLAERLSAYANPVLGTLTPLQPEIVKAFPLNFIRPHTLVAPRVALIGDAAHVVHPLAGHGMNLGFGDVNELLKAVNEREAHRDCGDARVLARYNRARAEEVGLMHLTTDGLARLFGSDLEIVRFARSAGMNLLERFPLLKRKLISHAMGK
jgi:2-polyprenylphenol 6-hydroxylase